MNRTITYYDLQVLVGIRWRTVSSQTNVGGLMTQADRARRDGETARIVSPDKQVIY